MLPIHSNDQRHHASDSGPVLASPDMPTPAADTSAASAPLSPQDHIALDIPATTHEDTNESAVTGSAGQHMKGVPN
ncbi:hypothetical protein NDA18_000307 [Ustilago nuda]|nr:hypothetical protein NDA18_000307 [Ustilago nuda]